MSRTSCRHLSSRGVPWAPQWLDRSIGADLMKTELMVPKCDRVEESFVTGDAFERFLLVGSASFDNSCNVLNELDSPWLGRGRGMIG